VEYRAEIPATVPVCGQITQVKKTISQDGRRVKKRKRPKQNDRGTLSEQRSKDVHEHLTF
jgi:hypothetical protein